MIEEISDSFPRDRADVQEGDWNTSSVKSFLTRADEKKNILYVRTL
jgi:hypothetical protein